MVINTTVFLILKFVLGLLIIINLLRGKDKQSGESSKSDSNVRLPVFRQSFKKRKRATEESARRPETIGQRRPTPVTPIPSDKRVSLPSKLRFAFVPEARVPGSIAASAEIPREATPALSQTISTPQTSSASPAAVIPSIAVSRPAPTPILAQLEKMFRTPQTVRTAFVLQEVLGRGPAWVAGKSS